MYLGLDLNYPHNHHLSFFRYFTANEHHITRRYQYNVLLIVFKGVLRFSEDDVPVEVGAGEYYIQKYGMQQSGAVKSDSPEYFYIEFSGEWTNTSPYLSKRGRFCEAELMPLIKRMEAAQIENMPLVVKNGLLYSILTKLYNIRPLPRKALLAEDMATKIAENLQSPIDLDKFSKEYHFGKNYLIKLFKAYYGITPGAFLEQKRISKAKALLLRTEATVENISLECGFSDYSHMYKTFKRLVGVSPGEFRKQS